MPGLGDGARRRRNARGASPTPWNGSWNGRLGNPLVLGAMVALALGIGAGSGCKALEHGSCKRTVSGSNPLTGSKYL